MINYRDFTDPNKINDWVINKNKKDIINIETIKSGYRVWYYF